MRALKSLTRYLLATAGLVLLSMAVSADGFQSFPLSATSQGIATAEVMTPISMISINGGNLAFGSIVPGDDVPDSIRTPVCDEYTHIRSALTRCQCDRMQLVEERDHASRYV